MGFSIIRMEKDRLLICPQKVGQLVNLNIELCVVLGSINSYLVVIH